ncbi:hypothetical protein Dimus_024072 [Dionaea muscipula]
MPSTQLMRKQQDEKGDPSKLSKRGMKLACKNCGEIGHNRRTCKQSMVNNTQKLPVRRDTHSAPAAQRKHLDSASSSQMEAGMGGIHGNNLSWDVPNNMEEMEEMLADFDMDSYIMDDFHTQNSLPDHSQMQSQMQSPSSNPLPSTSRNKARITRWMPSALTTPSPQIPTAPSPQIPTRWMPSTRIAPSPSAPTAPSPTPSALSSLPPSLFNKQESIRFIGEPTTKNRGMGGYCQLH